MYLASFHPGCGALGSPWGSVLHLLLEVQLLCSPSWCSCSLRRLGLPHPSSGISSIPSRSFPICQGTSNWASGTLVYGCHLLTYSSHSLAPSSGVKHSATTQEAPGVFPTSPALSLQALPIFGIKGSIPRQHHFTPHLILPGHPSPLCPDRSPGTTCPSIQSHPVPSCPPSGSPVTPWLAILWNPLFPTDPGARGFLHVPSSDRSHLASQ